MWSIFILLILLIISSQYVLFMNKNVLVIIYETNLNHPNLIKYVKTLKKFNYEYKIINDTKWSGFGRKIIKINEFLHTLPQDKIVVISDARDVFVSKSSKRLTRMYNTLAKNKILISTELGCCEQAKSFYEPNQLRFINGTSKSIISDNSMRKLKKIRSHATRESTKDTWLKSFKEMINDDSNGWYKPNAGLYMGRVKDIVKMYSLMNIRDNEDDQTILSEIILQNKDMFVLDYYSNIFSNSFAWDKNSKEIHGGCYYKKTNKGSVVNLMFKTEPFFLHFPGKHFWCYDRIYNTLN